MSRGRETPARMIARADIDVVMDLESHLRAALDEWSKRQRPSANTWLNVLMAVHNFHKFIVIDVAAAIKTFAEGCCKHFERRLAERSGAVEH